MARFRPANAGDVDAIVGMMRPYHEEDGYPFVESEAREMGVNAMHLEVERHRETALELYRRRGFEDLNRYLLTKWIGGEPRR